MMMKMMMVRRTTRTRKILLPMPKAKAKTTAAVATRIMVRVLTIFPARGGVVVVVGDSVRVFSDYLTKLIDPSTNESLQ
jgi:hypothetical protein